MRKARRLGYNVKAIRTIETTYRPHTNNFHPHIHAIVNDKELADFIIKEWLQRNPLADIKGQNITKVINNRSLLEIFKYITKIITNGNIYIEKLDIIFQAYRNRRVIQAYGIKMISEDIDELESVEIDDILSNTTVWEWFEKDWVNIESGELLTGYSPDVDIKDKITFKTR